MTTLARWSIALTSAVAALAAAAFAAGYSSIEQNDADWKRIALPTATEWFVFIAPFGVGLAALFLIANVITASRRSDAGTVLMSSIAWLFAFAWVLACLFVWRMPYMLIGERISP
jgi:hypothetical protein